MISYVFGTIAVMLQGRLAKTRHSLDWLGCSTSTYACSSHLRTMWAIGCIFVQWSVFGKIFAQLTGTSILLNQTWRHHISPSQFLPGRWSPSLGWPGAYMQQGMKRNTIYCPYYETPLGVKIKLFCGLPSVELRYGELFAPISVGSLGFSFIISVPSQPENIWFEARASSTAQISAYLSCITKSKS